MPLRRALAALALALVAGAAAPTDAGLIKSAGSSFAEGAVEKLKPALAATLADAELRITRAEDHIGNIAGGLVRKVDVVAEQRLDQVNRILEARLLQAQVTATEVTDHALGGVDELVKNRLAQADVIASKVVRDLGREAQSALETADRVLHERIGDLGRELGGAVEKADRGLAARIDQLDEATGRRLGNVDVIASKQRLALEETAVRTAVLIGLVVFVVFVMRRLWGRYQALTAAEPNGRHAPHPDDAGGQRWAARGGQRTWMFVRGLGVPLLGQLTAAALAVGALFLLYQRLPLGARNEAIALARTHEQQLAQSLALFDFPAARFHASQLEILSPGDGTRYRGLAAKAELVRDLFARPTLLATDPGVAVLWERLRGARRLIGRVPDPDLLVVEATLLWETGSSRRDEHRAASLCARALRLRAAPGGFALAPLARAIVEMFLDAPYVDAGAGLGRDSETPADLRAVLSAAPAEVPGEADHPLAAKVALMRLMRAVTVRSSTAYASMAQAHAALVEQLRTGAAARAKGTRDARNGHAAVVVQAWVDFDRALAATPELARNPAVLAVFRLNDTMYSRAKWYVNHPRADGEAPLLGAAAGPATKKTGAAPSLQVRMQLAPPRVAWARRYRALTEGPARELLELQEAERFAAREVAAQDLERALVAAAAAPDKLPAAALAAARMGLYVAADGPDGERVPFARVLLPAGGDESLAAALATRGVQLL